jgi:periplasmic protein TonB
MHTAANPAFRPASNDLRAMNRAMAWSVAVHVGAVLAILIVPREWIASPPRPVMTISLGGTSGPRSTGTTSLGGRTVEQAVPQPRRPEPIRPTPRNDPDPVAVKPPPQVARPAPAPAPAKPVAPAVRPPTTGPEVTQGNTRVDTGARGQGAGLTFGGGGTGGETNLADFCCPEYLAFMTSAIDRNWQKTQPERGTTKIRFTIQRNGAITDLQIVQPSGSSMLDRAAQRALVDTRLPPLPPAYPADKLTVNLTFPYEGH